jgi:hypothetical protein
MINPQASSTGPSQTRSVILIAVALFALSGLIVGFAVGAFTHPQTREIFVNNNNNTNKPAAHNTPTAAKTTTPVTPAQPLGCPIVTPQLPQDGVVVITVKAMNKLAGGQCLPNAETPITSSGITCRIWVVQATGTTPAVDGIDFKHTNTLYNPLNHEVQGALNFDATTPQTQTCKQGIGTWKITISPTLNKGSYFMVGLTDWNGTYYNWSWYRFSH